MFQFRRFPSYAYLIQRRMTEYCSAGFPHSEIHGYNGYLLLPVAYRSLSRPSSAPDAKAFPLRSFQLDLSPFSQRLVREFLVLFENYAGLQRSKLYVTLHPFECCSTINLLRRVSPHNASLLPYLLCHIVQFSRCRTPTTFCGQI